MEKDKNSVASDIAQRLIAEGLDSSAIDAVLKTAKSLAIAGTQLQTQSETVKILSDPAPREEQENELQLLEEIKTIGRLRAATSVTSGFGQKRGKNGGFQSFGEPRLHASQVLGQRDIRSWQTIGAASIGAVRKHLQSKGAEAVVGIGPLTRLEKVFEEPRPSKGVLAFLQGKPEKKLIGQKTVPVSLDKFLSNGDGSPAYEIVYIVCGKRNFDYTYQDPGTRRNGNILVISIVLPEALARRAFEYAKAHPTFLRKVTQEIDPELVAEQEFDPLYGLPKEERTLFVDPVESEKYKRIEERPQATVEVQWH